MLLLSSFSKGVGVVVAVVEGQGFQSGSLHHRTAQHVPAASHTHLQIDSFEHHNLQGPTALANLPNIFDVHHDATRPTAQQRPFESVTVAIAPTVRVSFVSVL